ncbi:PGF-CTERM sorting domain-containing protein [Haloglomus halophilum]|uniref:PGF-CTERM sorting domain-containing protein n=1 Tax=Haloglomus halophilum TaxID=2962672 RepID=UPI0020C999D3|nr:PGF-CTERM sorting domain-containing protein [Haloglomus halophilum]
MATALVLSAALVGVFATAPPVVGTADATTSSTSPHGADANFTTRLDNNAPGVTTANEYYASGLRKDMQAMHTIVLTSEAFQFDSCSSSQVRAFGIDRGNDDPGTQTDESLLSAYKSISFEKHQITVKFYKEDQLAGGPVGVKSADQIVARGDNCIQNPSEPGWYQISGKINGSTNGDTTTDFSQDTTSHYIYVCDCESRQEAEEKLGPPPGSDGGESTATPTESGGGESTATPTESGGGESTATPTESGGGESTATPTDGGGGESTATPTESGGGESTATPTDSNRQGQGTTTGTSTSTGNTTGTANATSTGNTTGTANATSTGNGGGFTGGGSQNDSPSPTNSGGQPGFGLAAALGALALAGLLARRQHD